MFDDVDGVENNLRRCNVILPSPYQNRLDDLHRRWKELQMKMLNRENTIQESVTEYDMNITQEPLQGEVYKRVPNIMYCNPPSLLCLNVFCDSYPKDD